MAKKKAVDKNTAIATWDEELAALAGSFADQVADIGGGGKYFSISQGRLMFDGAQVPGNEIVVSVIASVRENTYYTEAFDKDTPASPDCFALSDGLPDDMVPHADSASKQCSKCSECEHAEWGSARVGRGKACRNRIRLALIDISETNDKGEIIGVDANPDKIESADIAMLSVPPTSLRSWATYVNRLKTAKGLVPPVVATRITVEPDDDTTVLVDFLLEDTLSRESVGAILKRRQDALKQALEPYRPVEEAPAKNQKRGKKGSAGKAKKETANKKNQQQKRNKRF